MICTLLELWRIACSCISIWLACSYFCEFNFFVPFFFRCASFKWWEHTKTPQGWEDCPVPYLGSVSQLGRRIPTFSRILPLNTINNIVWFRFPFCSPFSRFRCFFGEKPACFFFQTSKMTCCSLTTFCQQALPWCLRLGDWHSSDGCSATGVPDVKRLVTGAGSEDFWIRVWTAQNGLLRKRCFTFDFDWSENVWGKFGRLFWYQKNTYKHAIFLILYGLWMSNIKGSELDRVRELPRHWDDAKPCDNHFQKCILALATFGSAKRRMDIETPNKVQAHVVWCPYQPRHEKSTRICTSQYCSPQNVAPGCVVNVNVSTSQARHGHGVVSQGEIVDVW